MRSPVRRPPGGRDVPLRRDARHEGRRVLDSQSGHRKGMLKSGAEVAAAYVGADTCIGSNATVRPSCSLGENVTVGAKTVVLADGAVVPDAVIEENAFVGSNATIADGEADVVVADDLERAIDKPWNQKM